MFTPPTTTQDTVSRRRATVRFSCSRIVERLEQYVHRQPSRPSRCPTISPCYQGQAAHPLLPCPTTAPHRPPATTWRAVVRRFLRGPAVNVHTVLPRLRAYTCIVLLPLPRQTLGRWCLCRGTGEAGKRIEARIQAADGFCRGSDY